MNNPKVDAALNLSLSLPESLHCPHHSPPDGRKNG